MERRDAAADFDRGKPVRLQPPRARAPTGPTPSSSPATRLVPQDQNGTLAKVYDAREEGGFPFLPDPVPCKASDECHGAGSAAPGPLPIGTITGNGGNAEEGQEVPQGLQAPR